MALKSRGSNHLPAGDLHAAHMAEVRTGVVDRDMVHAAIVPERDRTVMPTEIAGELRPLAVTAWEFAREAGA